MVFDDLYKLLGEGDSIAGGNSLDNYARSFFPATNSSIRKRKFDYAAMKDFDDVELENNLVVEYV